MLISDYYYITYIVFFLFIFVLFIFTDKFIQVDSSYLIIYNNSNINQFILYKFCSLWSNHEGSLLLWCFILIFYRFLLSLFYININNWLFLGLMILSILIEKLFIIITIKTSNPFLITEYFNKGSLDLNPILQDVLLFIHPPILYLGYIGFTIILIIITFYLLKIKFNFLILNLLKLFNLVAWMFLTLGIFLGSWWAYHELGWGGWWFWDPVENISLIPWIFSTLLAHALIQNNKINFNFIFKKHTIFLCFFIFIFNIFGTSFIRGGLLNSVHMFVNDNSRSIFLFSILFKLIWAFLHIQHLEKLNKKINLNTINKQKSKLVSLNNHFYITLNNLILFISNLIIILGTFLPFFFKKLNLIKSFFFNKILTPFVISSLTILNFLYLNKSKNFNKNFNLLFFYLVFLTTYICYISFFIEHGSFIIYLVLLLIANILLSFFFINKKNIKVLKVYFPHYGPILIITSLFISAKYELEFLKLLLPSNNVILENQLVILRNLFFNEKNNYNINFSNFLIKSNIFNNNLGVVFPEKRFFFLTNTYTSKGNIYSNILGDIQIFLSSGNLFDGWLFKFKYVPFVFFIWLGVLIIIFNLLSLIIKLIKINVRLYKISHTLIN